MSQKAIREYHSKYMLYRYVMNNKIALIRYRWLAAKHPQDGYEPRLVILTHKNWNDKHKLLSHHSWLGGKLVAKPDQLIKRYQKISEIDVKLLDVERLDL